VQDPDRFIEKKYRVIQMVQNIEKNYILHAVALERERMGIQHQIQPRQMDHIGGYQFGKIRFQVPGPSPDFKSSARFQVLMDLVVPVGIHGTQYRFPVPCRQMFFEQIFGHEL
jgi:hypothetical protein